MVTLEQIKELRARTGAGVGAVKEALEISKGDFDEAVKYLREKGLAKADKRKGKVATQGVIGTYIHSNNKMVVFAEVSCETDFAAKSEDILKFANDVALHIAAVGPKYITTDSVDKNVLAVEVSAAEQGLEGKPENIKKTIVDGKLEKFYQENVLLKQKLFSDESKTVQDYLSEIVAKIGEKVEISQFYKLQIGETLVSNTIFSATEDVATEESED